MVATKSENQHSSVPAATKRGEIVAFFVLAVLIWPIMTVAVVGGYGFLVWMWQVIFGPPGPPVH